MKNVIYIPIVFAAILAATIASAKSVDGKCPQNYYEAIAQQLKIDALTSRDVGGKVISESCKDWPQRDGLALAAFAYDEGVEYEKKLVVAVIDKETDRVVSSYQYTIGEDAVMSVGESSLKLDTARYQLAKDVKAFGLRFNSSARGASCGEASWGDELTLLVPDGDQLRPVLTVSMLQQKSIEGCLSTQWPDAIWEDAALTVRVGKASANGYYDLNFSAKITVNYNDAKIGKYKDRTEHYTLRYNGKFYDKVGKKIPWWLGF